MLDTAIEILLKGEAAAKVSEDPFGEGPFGYRKLASGFELSSELTFRDAPVTMRFGS